MLAKRSGYTEAVAREVREALILKIATLDAGQEAEGDGSSRSRDCGPVGRGSGANDKSAIDLPSTPEIESDTAIAMLAACCCGNPCGGRAKH
jgi:hypothetical protein